MQASTLALGDQMYAYGFPLVVWGTGGLVAWQLGKPDPVEVLAHLGLFRIWHPFDTPEPRRPFSAMHRASAPAAAAAERALTLTIGAAAYQLLLAVEVALAFAPRRRRARR